MEKEREVHVTTILIPDYQAQYKFTLPGNAPLLEVLQTGAHLAGKNLLPNPQNPLDRLHIMLSHNNVGPPIEDLQEQIEDFLKHEHEGNHFGIQLVLAFRVNARWAIAPQPELSPRQILDLFGMNYEDYSLYNEGSSDLLPLDIPILITRGKIFEAQRDGKYGGGL
jgi:hypothetical protein